DMQTHADSVRHAALQGFLLSDSAQFTQEFLDRAVDLRYYNDTFSAQRLRHAAQELGQRISEQWPVHAVWLLLLVMGLSVLGPRHPDMRAALAATGLFWAVIIGLVLVLVDEMKPRFMEPFAGMVVFMVMLRLIPSLLEGRGRVPMAALLGVCLAGVLVFKGNVLHQGAKAYRQHDRWALEAQERFRTCSAPYRVMGFTNADVPFVHGVFHRHRHNPYARLGFFDGGYLVYFPHFKHHFSELFHCSPVDYPCLVEIIRNDPDIRFYATEERLQTVADYFRGSYHVEMSFKKVNDGCDLGLNAQFCSVTLTDTATPH
ncbi:MAG: hypothetical protein K9J06_09665, partial [Flavobacteriales bacterium]|nr:hypothetical protein [Flavobacteriales bacterium]